MSTDNNQKDRNPEHETMMVRATIASVSTGIFLAVIKLIAYLFTGSVALLTSLIDSVIDIFTSLVNMFAVKQSLIPADKEHRFGHGKIESLAGLAQSAFIAGSVMFIVFEAANRLIHPEPIENGALGLIVMIISMIATLALVYYQRKVIKETGSVAIKADSLHYVSDIMFNASVILAIVLSYYFGITSADPLIAMLIAAYIIYGIINIARHCLDQLLDRELPDEDREEILKLLKSHSEVRDVHGFRTRASGRDIFIQCHIELDGDLSLVAAHEIAEQVQRKIQHAYPNADIIIHQDPGNDE